MNFTSAGVNLTFDRSVAFSAEMIWLASPGAPGCTIGTAPFVPPASVPAAAGLTVDDCAAVRHAPSSVQVATVMNVKQIRLHIMFEGDGLVCLDRIHPPCVQLY